MSHDRGCSCGKEPYEYHECRVPSCDRRIRAMRLQSVGLKKEENMGVIYQDSIPELMQKLDEVAKPDLTKDSGDAFLDELDNIAREDAEGLKTAQKSYGNSWKSRGGVGAFMMLARKWDRMDNRVKSGHTVNRSRENLPNVTADPYDIFAAIAIDPRAEGVIDDIRDLRRYLMLVEAEMRARGFDATHRDNKP